MAARARLTPPREERSVWPWHQTEWQSVPASLLMRGDRRLEAENYLSSGNAIQRALESRATSSAPLARVAHVTQPSRLRGIIVNPGMGTPFLAATQVYDARPTPRKWLSLEDTDKASERVVARGVILVTRSGNVGRTAIAYKPHENTVISDDLLRIEPRERRLWGWIYAFLRSSYAQAMMSSSKYGHVIKHLEIGHLNGMPIPVPDDEVLQGFNRDTRVLLEMRDRACRLLDEAEQLFDDSIGPVSFDGISELGFEVPAEAIESGRQRLDASFYSPAASSIVRRFAELELPVETLRGVTDRIWWMTRFKRVFGKQGVPYVSADELFSLNPQITKYVLTAQVHEAEKYFVKSGWIVMACSGQTYGLNGTVALMTPHHERLFVSQDIIRIIPRVARIRPGYLFCVLGHPRLGRPLVLRNAYGTSIPHVDPVDIAHVPIVRLGKSLENEIADRTEASVRLRAEADQLENSLTSRAEQIVGRVLQSVTG